MDEELEREYQAELEALEKFRLAYTGLHPDVPLQGDDPDVRRLLDALAFFSARTHLAARRGVDLGLLRILRQHFPYLLSPVPAMAMLQATPRDLVEATMIPAGSELDLVKPRTFETPEQTFRFSTTAPLRLLPLSLRSTVLVKTRGRAPRLVFVFSVSRSVDPAPAVDAIDLHVDYLNDLGSSLLLFSEVRRHAIRASATWRSRPGAVGDAVAEAPCTVSFGASSDSAEGSPLFPHPLDRLRSLLHFPQQELYVRFGSLRSPAGWRELELTLELDDDWPDTLQINRDYFRLHAVPMANLVRASADPIEHDGTKDRQLARHPNSREGFVPVAVRAVYQATKQGLRPLRPTVLGSKEDSYEALFEKHGAERRLWMALSLPGAFAEPATVVIDAIWHQPALARMRGADLQPLPSKRAVDAGWSMIGGLSMPLEMRLEDDRETLLELLALKGQTFLDAQGLGVLLRCMGVENEPSFARCLAALATCTVADKPSGRRTRALKHVYDITFGPLGSTETPKLEVFCARIFDLLAAWSGEEIVELRVRVPSAQLTLRYPTTDQVNG